MQDSVSVDLYCIAEWERNICAMFQSHYSANITTVWSNNCSNILVYCKLLRTQNTAV